MKKLPLYVFKVILIGEPAVGKTSLVKKYVTDKFSEEYKSTMGANIYLKTLELDDGTKIKFTLWDLAGQQDRWAQMLNVYFQGSQGVLIVYDVSRKSTFNRIETDWLPNCEKHIQGNHQKVLIANKIDLENKEVSSEEGKALKERIGCIDFIETSAKENKNVNEAFTTLAKALVKNIKVD
ncbi:MAG: GTP-binding protein [Candidatus Helarchaeota archaeon]